MGAIVVKEVDRLKGLGNAISSTDCNANRAMHQTDDEMRNKNEAGVQINLVLFMKNKSYKKDRDGF